LLSDKEKNERLKKNMETFEYFRKYSHYDAKFVAAKFVEECEIRIRIDFKNAKIRKHSFRIQKAKFAHAWNLVDARREVGGWV
jgi:hypothetical protein